MHQTPPVYIPVSASSAKTRHTRRRRGGHERRTPGKRRALRLHLEFCPRKRKRIHLLLRTVWHVHSDRHAASQNGLPPPAPCGTAGTRTYAPAHARPAGKPKSAERQPRRRTRCPLGDRAPNAPHAVVAAQRAWGGRGGLCARTQGKYRTGVRTRFGTVARPLAYVQGPRRGAPAECQAEEIMAVGDGRGPGGGVRPCRGPI